MLLSEVLEKFIKEQHVKGSTEDTIRHYKNHIQYFINFVDNIEVEKVTYDMYQEYIIYLKAKDKENRVIKGQKEKLSSRTVKTYASAVKTFLHFAYEKEYINIDISEQIKMPKYKRKTIMILDKTQIEVLIRSQNEFTFTGIRNLLIISFMLDCGLRLIEVTRLRKCDIFLEKGLVNVDGKGQKERLIPMSEVTQRYYRIYIDMLENLLNRSLFAEEILLKTTELENITKNSISLMFKRLRVNLKFNKLHPHLLRHTFATMFILNGGDIVTLQIILGHTTLNMVLQYLHLANTLRMSTQSKYAPLSNL